MIFSTAMRLANDVRTFEREQQEGGVNAVVIRAHEIGRTPGTPAEDLSARAVESVRADVAQAIDDLTELTSIALKKSTMATGFSRATKFGVGLYDAVDFRLWTEASGIGG